MSYGFQALDAAGRLLISDAVGGYGYRGSYIASPNTHWDTVMACGGTTLGAAISGHMGPWMLELPKTQFPSPPLVLFELPSWPNGCGLNGMDEFTSSWRYFFLSTVQPVVHVFGVFTDEQRSTVGMGLQAFDSNGRLTFDSLARRPLQLMSPPLIVTAPQPTFPVNSPSWPTYFPPTAYNDTLIEPAFTLPATVLVRGQAAWYSLYTLGSSGGGGGSKGSPGIVIGHWWRLFGRDGNNIRYFIHQHRLCEPGQSGEAEPHAVPKAYTAQVMLADKALYI